MAELNLYEKTRELTIAKVLNLGEFGIREALITVDFWDDTNVFSVTKVTVQMDSNQQVDITDLFQSIWYKLSNLRPLVTAAANRVVELKPKQEVPNGA